MQLDKVERWWCRCMIGHFLHGAKLQASTRTFISRTQMTRLAGNKCVQSQKFGLLLCRKKENTKVEYGEHPFVC